MVQKKRKLRCWHVLLIAAGALAALLVYCYVGSLFLRVETYVLEAEISAPIRIVHLTDLHNSEYGENNRKLVRMVAEQEPDLIFISGDMLNADDPDTSIVTTLIGDLVPIAPVYYGYGNHEKVWERSFDRSIRSMMEAAGAVVVDNDYVDLELKGNLLRIGGYMGYFSVPHMMTGDKAQQSIETQFAGDFQNTDRLKLLINHIPTPWVDWDYVDKYSVDFVFSGHYHGGVIRIPILDRGLYAPYVGWLPPFTKGVYSGGKATCVLSAGLGTERFIPRLNNPPEVVVVDLLPGRHE